MVKWGEKEKAIQALERDGKVDPRWLVKAARDKRHPCHDDFTWDIQRAAEERWRDQARSLIRRCKFEVLHEDVTEPVVQFIPGEDEDEEAIFVSVPKLRGKGKVKAAVRAELAQILGIVARTRGLALAKQGIIGPNVAAQLSVVAEMIRVLQDEME